jgi:hypothetical protein
VTLADQSQQYSVFFQVHSCIGMASVDGVVAEIVVDLYHL